MLRYVSDLRNNAYSGNTIIAKRLVFCFDGTWNRLSADNPTNVVKLAQMVCPVASDGTPQLVYYDEGIGTGTYFAKRLFQGFNGDGMERILREAYRFLIFNHEPGDELFIFGFSRGAFTARSFAGFIRHAGILDVASASRIDDALRIYREAPAGITGSESLDALAFRAEHCTAMCVSEDDRAYRRMTVAGFDPETPVLDIRYLGVWDTVRALGVPDRVPFSQRINSEHGFHDAVLTSKIASARHAVALDERRITFPPTLFGRDKVEELNARRQECRTTPFEPWERPYQEQWFPGVHGAIGGGGADRKLSDAALHWVLSGARRAGLQLRGKAGSVVFDIRPDAMGPIYNDPIKWTKRLQARFHNLVGAKRRGPRHRDEIALTTFQRWHRSRAEGWSAECYDPKSLRFVGDALNRWDYASPPEWKARVGADAAVLEEFETRGETLGSLAKERLGGSERWRELFELNRDRIDDPDYLPTDIVLRVPRKHEDGDNLADGAAGANPH